MTTEPQQPAVLDDERFEEILVKDGPGGLRAKRFVGRFLAEAREHTKTGIEVTKVYRSRKGKFVAQRQATEWLEFPNHADLVAELKSDWRNWRNLLGFGPELPEWGDYTVEIVDSIEELRERISPKLYRRVAAAVETPRTDDLDI
ncbi:EXLDI protein [Nocardia sp. CDC159]|uniref:EXLDI protein n=1 Tax=Nocardia pulmonis TaxID=2951408 RepID=A0A9X2IZH1_9NOCA|nr:MULTISPECIES: EXLDI protein [Nocardia]MCM6776020.1 EXLDI protein [Nocardia pulmonis]MCM6788653.1 EXLDI protein [Nocardia sp. CDC159]